MVLNADVRWIGRGLQFGRGRARARHHMTFWRSVSSPFQSSGVDHTFLILLLPESFDFCEGEYQGPSRKIADTTANVGAIA